MIDPASVASGFLSAALFFLIFALLHGWVRWLLSRDWQRVRHYWQVALDQYATDAERAAVVWVGRFCYVWVLVQVARIGW